jgi:hypothetical protein
MNRPAATPRQDTTASTPDLFLPVTSPHGPVPRRSAPGLGIVPDSDDGTGLLRYSVVHLGSGLAVFGCVTSRCAVHVQQAVALMGASGIDWTQPPAVLAAQPVEVVRHFLLDSLGLCFDPETAQAINCLGDPPAAAHRADGAA